jgi:hypothetical protein
VAFQIFLGPQRSAIVGAMNTDDILNAIDAEIARLQQARNSLAGPASPKRRDRSPTSAPTARRRTLSPAARKKIADAQRKRWANQKAAAKKAAKAKKATKETPAKKVTVTRVPPKQRRERTLRISKKPAVKNALSSKSETVAVPEDTPEKS